MLAHEQVFAVTASNKLSPVDALKILHQEFVPFLGSKILIKPIPLPKESALRGAAKAACCSSKN